IQRERGISYLFIAHDLSVVEHISHTVAVMYLGRIVERAPREALYREPRHPYTRMLLAAVPSGDPERRRKARQPTGDVPSPVNPPPGCPFHPRCRLAEAECRAEMPPMVEVERGHFVRCFRAGGEGGTQHTGQCAG
ncbi:MAG: ABC transporter ATP-binding protein, partial [Candidatus Brocadiaceae bacterium]